MLWLPGRGPEYCCSLNAWGGTRHNHLLPWITATAPDVLCLQEVIDSPVPVFWGINKTE